MNWQWSESSLKQLETCNPYLINLANRMLRASFYDLKITCGFRNKQDQNEAFLEGNSQLKWPNSRHNRYPSRAFDFIVYKNGIQAWDDRELLATTRGIAYGIASELGIKLKPTIQWDLYHIELADDFYPELRWMNGSIQ